MDDGVLFRAEGVEALRNLVVALQRHASPGRARLRLGPHRAFYEPVWDELQGYARPLWGMAALFQSGEGAALGEEAWVSWQQGLLSGTNPAHAEYWGQTHDYSQAFCEMAPIALSLLWAGEIFWEPLSAGERELVVEWLDQINGHSLNQNNWLWFRILVNAVFYRLGTNYHRENLEHDIAATEAMAGEAGWYLDGCAPGKRTADLYIPSAFHLYGLISAELLAPLLPAQCEQWRERARQFARTWQWFQAEDGAPLLWGRSLCYRSCSAAFWAACAWASWEVLPWSKMAFLWRSQMRWWQTRKPFREDGCLALGYGYPNEKICENYISHTSPYWQTKAWLALRHSAAHPFWHSASAPPLDTRPSSIVLSTCGGLLVPDSSSPLLLLAGQWGADWLDPEGARYGRWAYDAHHGFQIDPGHPSPDNALLIRPVGSERWASRRQPESWSLQEGVCTVKWSPIDGVQVQTTMQPLALPRCVGHARIHRITTLYPIEVIEGGFACPVDPSGFISTEKHRVSIRCGGLYSALLALDQRTTSIHVPAPQTNTLYSSVQIPVVSTNLPAGEHLLQAHIFHAEFPPEVIAKKNRRSALSV